MSRILLHGAWVCTEQDGRQAVIENGYVGVDGDTIAYVGKEKPAGYEQAETISREYGLIIPGLVDLHYHSDSPATKGFCEDCGSVEMFGSILYEYLTAIYAATTVDEWRAIARLTFAEMIANGITTCVEFNSYYPEDMAELLGECGLRGYIAPETNSLEGYPYSPDGKNVIIEHKTGADMFKKLERNVLLIEKYNGAYNDRVRVTLGPTEPPACRPELLREVRKLSASYPVPITMHAARRKSNARTSAGIRHGFHRAARGERDRRAGRDSGAYRFRQPARKEDHVGNTDERRALPFRVRLPRRIHALAPELPGPRHQRRDRDRYVPAGYDSRDANGGVAFQSCGLRLPKRSVRPGLPLRTQNARNPRTDDIGRLSVGAKADLRWSKNDFNTIPVRDPSRFNQLRVGKNVTTHRRRPHSDEGRNSVEPVQRPVQPRRVERPKTIWSRFRF
jgi:cytosine/adenosine deaminase-related metal-dependent hydrolase